MRPEDITENLLTAGCGEKEAERIVSALQGGNLKKAEKLIAGCRKKQLDRLHESQACIDRLDYLCYRLGKA